MQVRLDVQKQVKSLVRFQLDKINIAKRVKQLEDGIADELSALRPLVVSAIDRLVEGRTMSVQEAATALQTTPVHMYRLIRDGVIPKGVYLRLGRGLRIDQTELENWMGRGGQGFLESKK